MRKIIAILLSALLVLASLGCGSQAESKVEWGRADAKEIDVNSKVAGRVVELLVKEGDEVKAGTVIGTLGETNLAEVAENSHLHFAMKQDGKFIDPKEKLGIS